MLLPRPTPLVDDPATDDAALVRRCRAGDAAAWEALVRRYQRVVHGIARSSGLDEQLGADVFQTVFLRLLQHLPRIAEPERLQAWLVTTAKRESWLQRQRSRRLVSWNGVDSDEAGGVGDDHGDAPRAQYPGQRADAAPGPEATVEHWQQLAQVQLGLQRLDPRCRQLLQALFHAEAPGYELIARRLDMPVGSIGPTRSRCLAKLRGLVE